MFQIYVLDICFHYVFPSYLNSMLHGAAANKLVNLVIKSPRQGPGGVRKHPREGPRELIECHFGSRGCSGGGPAGVREGSGRAPDRLREGSGRPRGEAP